VTGVIGAVSIAAGAAHTCALSRNGSVTCWGDNSALQLGSGTDPGGTTPRAVGGLPPAVAIAAGGKRTCAVSSAAAVWCWGDGLPPAPVLGF
jgi:alpha-tubulin suppressor-like RCC1 family protein